MGVTCRTICVEHFTPTKEPAKPSSAVSWLSEPDWSACLLQGPAHLETTWGPVRGFKLSLCHFQQQPVHPWLSWWTDRLTPPVSPHPCELCWAPQHPRVICSILPFHPAHILIFPALINWFAIPRAFQVVLNKRVLLPRKRLQLEKDLELQLQGI